MESEITGVVPQAEECLEALEAGIGKEGFSARAFGRNVSLLTRWVCISSLQTTREYILSHQVCGNLLWQPLEANILSRTERGGRSASPASLFFMRRAKDFLEAPRQASCNISLFRDM